MKYIQYILLLSIFGFIACTEDVTEDIAKKMDEQESSRLVVEGSITTEAKAHQVRLTHTANYFSNVPTPIESGAAVTISDGDQTITLEEGATPGIYETASDFAGEAGKTYTLNVTTIDGEEYTSSSLLPTVEPMDSIVAVDTIFPMTKEQYYSLRLYAHEPQGKGDSYMFNIYMKDSTGAYNLCNDTLNETSFVNDELIDGMHLRGIEVYRLDRKEVDKLGLDVIDVRVDMLSMTKEQYDFYIAVVSESAEGMAGMFGGPPANIPTNISNGAFGFFSASDVTSYEFKLIKQK